MRSSLGYALSMALDRKALDDVRGASSARSRRSPAAFMRTRSSASKSTRPARGSRECLARARRSKVERGVGGLATAFRARGGRGGPRLAILGEYDALPGDRPCLRSQSDRGRRRRRVPRARPSRHIRRLGGDHRHARRRGRRRQDQAARCRGLPGHRRGDDVSPVRSRYSGAPARSSAWLIHDVHVGARARRGRAARRARARSRRAWKRSGSSTSQRVHFRDGVRVHGYITNGGQAVNIIPELAACEFSVRARDVAELERVRGDRRALRARRGDGERRRRSRSRSRAGYRDMRNNLDDGAPLRRAPRSARSRKARETDTRVGAGSTDMGDVSQSCRRFIRIWPSSTRVSRCATSTASRMPRSDRGLRPRSSRRRPWRAPRSRSSPTSRSARRCKRSGERAGDPRALPRALSRRPPPVGARLRADRRRARARPRARTRTRTRTRTCTRSRTRRGAGPRSPRHEVGTDHLRRSGGPPGPRRLRRHVPRHGDSSRRHAARQRAAVLLRARRAARQQRLLHRRHPRSAALSRGRGPERHPPRARRARRLLSGRLPARLDASRAASSPARPEGDARSCTAKATCGSSMPARSSKHQSPMARAPSLVAGRYSYTAALVSLAAAEAVLQYWDYQARTT